MGTTRLSLPQELVRAKDLAEEQGWRVEKTRGNHVRWVPPDPGDGTKPEVVITATTPSQTGIVRDMKLLRRAGLIIDPGEVRRWRKERAEAAAGLVPSPELAVLNGDKPVHVCRACGARFTDPNAWAGHPRYCPKKQAQDEVDSEHVSTNGSNGVKSDPSKVNFERMSRAERNWWEVRAGVKPAPKMAARLKAEDRPFVASRANYDAAIAQGWEPSGICIVEAPGRPATVKLNQFAKSSTRTPTAPRTTEPKVEPVAAPKAKGTCPICGVEMAKQNLQRHIDSRHRDVTARTPENLMKALMEVVFPDGPPMDPDTLIILADWIGPTKNFLGELAKLEAQP